MDKWEKYRVSDSPNMSTDRWKKYEIKPTESEGDSWVKLIPKALASGALSLADLPKIAEIPYQLKFGGEQSPAVKEALRRNNLNSDNSEQDTLFEKGREKLKPNPTTEAQRIATHAAEFAGANIIPGLGVAKGIKQIAKLGGMGAAIGGASGTAQEYLPGTDPFVADLIASAVVPTATKIPALTARGLGLTGRNFNLSAAQHAKKLGIELPAATLTENGVGRIAEEYLAKVPIIGKQIKNKYKKANEQTQNVIEDILDKTGPKRTPEWEQMNAALYKKARDIPSNAAVYPIDTLTTLSKIKTASPIVSAEMNSLMKDLNALKKLLAKGKPVPISTLVDIKQQLNDKIKWDTPTSVRDRLKTVRSSLLNDIKRYENINPEWYKTFKAADENYAAMARREKVQKALVTNKTNYNTGEVNQNSLAKTIFHPDSARILQKNLSPVEFKRLQDLGEVSRALNKRSKDILNPSGTATTAATNLGLLYGAIAHPIKTTLGVGAGMGLKGMLTNQKWIDSAILHAISPDSINNLSLTNLRKDILSNLATSVNRNRKESQ